MLSQTRNEFTWKIMKRGTVLLNLKRCRKPRAQEKTLGTRLEMVTALCEQII